MNHAAIVLARCFAISAFVAAVPVSGVAGTAPHRDAHPDDGARHESPEHGAGCPSPFEGLVFRPEAASAHRARSEGIGSPVQARYAGPNERDDRSGGQRACREHWQPASGNDFMARR